MKEVSCKVFDVHLPTFAPKGLTLEAVVAGTSVTPAQLTNKKERIDWSDYVAIMKNLRPHFTDEEYVEIGRSYMRVPGLRFAFVIARMLMRTPMDFYRWFSKPRQGVGNQMFTCIMPSHREISKYEIELDLVLPEGYEVCWDFFLISSGNMEEMPRLLGLPRSQVVLSRLPRGGRMHITVPQRTPLRSRIWRVLTWPFTARAAARELRAAHETLLERYQELETARAKLTDYQVNLEKLVDERTLELRETRDQLAGTVEQLREAQSARQKFFANISHEIRTPLSLIVLAAGDVEARASELLDERARQSLGSITQGARKLLRLVDELLLLAAGQENKLVLRPEPTDLAALIAHMHAAWRPAAEAAQLALELRVPASLVAMVDPVALERVASNLVSNAIKYTPPGGRVEVELVDEPAGPRLSVLDTGQGIDADLAARLFGRFERSATTAAQTTGTGIGLALVKQLVEAHGGIIEATARPGGGTEMRVVLPPELVTTAAAAVSRPRLHIAAAATPTVASGMVLVPPGLSAGTILIAEDDPNLAHQISQLLAATYTVVVALDGEAALELVKQHQPQLLITDVDMPRMNGIELSRRFRAVTGDSLAPIIILSAVVDLGTRVAGLDAGAVDYVGKPFDPRELEARVRSQFRMRELAVRLHRAEQLATLGILTSGLAHELRNPANGIVNAIAPILEMLPAETPKGVRALMEVMEECAQQIGFLSRQLLGFRGNSELELQPAQVPELVQRAVAIAQRSLAGVEVRTAVALERAVMCAPPLLVQVLTNLIENGAHAAGRGGWVDVRASRDASGVAVEVTDSGPGVPLALRERIFEPFFTTKPQGVGTGLGLSVARAIVQRHGGNLEVRERGQRTAFVIQLPDSKTA